MGALKDATAEQIAEEFFTLTGGFNAPTVIAAALHTTAPTASTAGTEVANSNGYARTSIGTGDANWSNTGGVVTNDANVDLGPASGGAWGTVVGMALCDSATYGAGNQLCFDDFTGVAINDGDTARFTATTGITVTFT